MECKVMVSDERRTGDGVGAGEFQKMIDTRIEEMKDNCSDEFRRTLKSLQMENGRKYAVKFF